MAWHEKDRSGYYFVCFRLIEQGRMIAPPAADPISYLMSDGIVQGPVQIPDALTLSELFTKYFAAIPEGGLEATTIYNMKLHQGQLEKHFKPSFQVRTLSATDLQGYVEKRAKHKGRNGKVTGVTIKKAVVTLRTVWNWAVHTKLLCSPFPGRGLKYPKSKEKPAYMPFSDVERRTRKMPPEEAAELWECAFLTTANLIELLAHVRKAARHRFIYPLFVFAAHTGARRSEIARARVSDVDFSGGVVTLRERKRAHDKQTTRRVPMSGLLKRVLKEWLADHPGGNHLFCHEAVVSRSKSRSLTTGHPWKDRPKSKRARLATVVLREPVDFAPLTRDELHDHFRRTLAGSKWENLHGWHTFRHSFISCLAASGCDQRIIDEFVSHCTEEQRRRYRHLLPSSTKQAIANVFG